MSTIKTKAEEIRIAEEILSVLPAGSVARVCSDDREMLRFSVSNPAIKLRSVVLDRESLQRLASDPSGAVKIEYLQRELECTAGKRAEFRYPRFSRMFRKTAKKNRLRAAAMAVAVLAR